MKNLLKKIKDMDRKVIVAGCGIVAVSLAVIIGIVIFATGRKEDKDNIIGNVEKTKNVETTIMVQEETTSKKEETTKPEETTTKEQEETTTKEPEETTNKQEKPTQHQQQTTKKEVPTQKYEQQTTKAPEPTTQKELSPFEKIEKDDPDWDLRGISPEYKKKLESYGIHIELGFERAFGYPANHTYAYEIPNDIASFCDKVAIRFFHEEITAQQCYDILYDYLYNYNSEPDIAWCNVCQGYHDTQHTIPLTNGCVYPAAENLVIYYSEGVTDKQIGSGSGEGYGLRYLIGDDFVAVAGNEHYAISHASMSVGY